MCELLQSVTTDSVGTGKSYKVSSFQTMAKTGTTSDTKDAWLVGGTPYYVASCWSGFETMQPIPSAHSGIALKLWGNVMSKAHAGLKEKEFKNSSYAVEKYYCKSTGNLATDGCPEKAVGWYKKSNTPELCTAHAGEAMGNPADTPLEETSSQGAASSTTSSTTTTTSSTTTSSTASQTTTQ